MAHGDRSVDVFVRKLRQKLAAPSPSWRYIHTHFGIGYRFDPEAAGRHVPRRAGRDASGDPGRSPVSQASSQPFTPR